MIAIAVIAQIVMWYWIVTRVGAILHVLRDLNLRTQWDLLAILIVQPLIGDYFIWPVFKKEYWPGICARWKSTQLWLFPNSQWKHPPV